MFHDRRLIEEARSILYPIWAAEAYYNNNRFPGWNSIVRTKKFRRFTKTFSYLAIDEHTYILS